LAIADSDRKKSSQHRTLVRNCAPEDLEIPWCAIAHQGSVLRIAPGND